MTRPKAWILAALLPLALTVPACGAGSANTSDDVVVFGMDQDDSSGSSSFASIVGKTVRDEIEQINNNGGILGKQVKLIVKSDDNDPTKAPAVVRQLISEGADVIIMNSSGQSVLQVQSLLRRAQVPAIAPVNITPGIGSGPNDHYTYSLANPTSDFGKLYARAFVETGVSRLAVIKDDSAPIAGLMPALLGPLKSAGIKIVANETVPRNAHDVTAQVSKVKQANPQAVLVSSLGGQTEIMVHNTLQQLAPRLPRFSLASIGNQPQTWKSAAPGALDGLVWVGSLHEGNKQTKKLATFLRTKRGSGYRTTAYDAQAYDAVRLFKRAIEKAGSTDGQAVNKALESTRGYPASFGQPGFTLSFSGTKHTGADGLCGLVLKVFDGNSAVKPWKRFQPECS